MKKQIGKVVGAYVVSALVASSVAWTAPLKVVSSFSILGDLVEQVGGDKVESAVIVGAESDAHAFEPRPSDARTLQHADLLVINGAQFEAWLPRLLEAAGYKGKVVEAIQGVPLRAYEEDEHDHEHKAHNHDHEAHNHDHGEYDPHAWQSLSYAQHYISNIRDALTEADPESKAYFAERADKYSKQLEQMHADLIERFKAIPEQNRIVVTSHDAFAYLSQDYGIEFLALLGASNHAEPSAKEMAGLIEYMQDNNVKAVFMENISNPKLVEQIARETGAKVGKTLYSDALAKAPHAADTYMGMMKWNTEALLEALTP